MVKLHTNHGIITLELDEKRAPATVANFLEYVKSGHFSNTLFHRVINGFMIQGGGFEPGMKQKPTRAPFGTRPTTSSRTRTTRSQWRAPPIPTRQRAQFFINVADNAFLDHTAPTPQGWGYCVFGRVVEGTDVVDKIKGGQDRSEGHAPGRAAAGRDHRARGSGLGTGFIIQDSGYGDRQKR